MSNFVQDSVHGYIKLNESETRVVDTEVFQRLRRIEQLGLTSLVYPSANHTRFQHSLGVLHTAGRFADSLGVDKHVKQELRMAGLLHDIGHGPFSHASEKVAEKQGIHHEDLSCKKVDKLEDILDVSADRVKKIIRGELEIGKVVAGDIDADRMDYLQRDSHFTGVNYGNIDVDTIIRIAEIDSRRIVFDYKGVQALESLLTARLHMIKSVYFHETCRIAEKMLERALDEFCKQKSVENMMRLDDYEAHSQLKNYEDENGLYSRLAKRDLFKAALKKETQQIEQDKFEALSGKSEREIEEVIASKAGINERDVLVDIPTPKERERLDVRVKKDGEVRKLDEISSIASSVLETEKNLLVLGVYCPEDNVDKVKPAAKTFLNTL